MVCVASLIHSGSWILSCFIDSLAGENIHQSLMGDHKFRDQTHLGHHKPTHLGHHRQETHLEHHISTHLGHHRQHFCERVVTGGHSLIRSPTPTYHIPLGLDMGTWGLGDMVLLDHIPKQTTHL